MKTLLLLLASTFALFAQSQNENVITIIPTTNSTGGATAPGQVRFLDTQNFYAGLSAPNGGVTQLIIASATAANPMVMTMSATPPAAWVAGFAINISLASGTGCTSMNGLQTISGVTGSAVTITYNGTGCSYTPSTGTVATNWVYQLPSGGGTGCWYDNGMQVLTLVPCAGGGTGTPGGPASAVQVNCPTAGTFCGYAAFEFNNVTGALTVEGTSGSIFTRDIGTPAIVSPQSAMFLGLINTGSENVGAGPSQLFSAWNTAGVAMYLGRVSGVWANPTAGSEQGALSFMVRANTGDTFAYTEVLKLLNQSLAVENSTYYYSQDLSGTLIKMFGMDTTESVNIGAESVTSLGASGGALNFWVDGTEIMSCVHPYLCAPIADNTVTWGSSSAGFQGVYTHAIVFPNLYPLIGTMKLTTSASGTIYQFTLPPDGGSVCGPNCVLTTNGSGITNWATVFSLIPDPLAISYSGAGAAITGSGTGTGSNGLSGAASGTNGIGGLFFATGTGGIGVSVNASANALIGVSISNTSIGGATGLLVQTSAAGSQAAVFKNGSLTGTYWAVTAENDYGGAGQGPALSVIGSLDAWGSNTSNRLHYDGPTNTLSVVDSGSNSVAINSNNINLTGQTATNSYIDITNSSGYKASLGFVSATVPALAGGTISSPVIFPLPSNAPTATYVLTGNGAGVATSWQPASFGSVTSIATTAPLTGGTITTSGVIGCATCLTTGGGQTVVGIDTFSNTTIFTGPIGSNFAPNGSYNLGSSGNPWNTFYTTTVGTNLTPTGTHNLGAIGAAWSTEYLTNLGDVSNPVTQAYFTTIGSTSRYITSYISTAYVSSLSGSVTSCVYALSTGQLAGTGLPCATGGGSPSSWSTFVPGIFGFSGTPTVNFARYQSFGSITWYTVSFTGVSNGGFIAINAPQTVNSTPGSVTYIGTATQVLSGGAGQVCAAYANGGTSQIQMACVTPASSGSTYTIIMSGTYEN